jgi:hypothetical protein
MTRLIIVLASVAALVLGVAGVADAAGKGEAKGHLILNVHGVVSTLAPGQAVKQADAACVGGVHVVAASVDAARAAFPAAFAVCDGVTLTSQVAAD